MGVEQRGSRRLQKIGRTSKDPAEPRHAIVGLLSDRHQRVPDINPEA
ncbi:hypothetical protein [Rhodococcus ruber]|nr:hypothetical protein [Rhodococcus ruber]